MARRFTVFTLCFPVTWCLRGLNLFFNHTKTRRQGGTEIHGASSVFPRDLVPPWFNRIVHKFKHRTQKTYTILWKYMHTHIHLAESGPIISGNF